LKRIRQVAALSEATSEGDYIRRPSESAVGLAGQAANSLRRASRLFFDMVAPLGETGSKGPVVEQAPRSGSFPPRYYAGGVSLSHVIAIEAFLSDAGLRSFGPSFLDFGVGSVDELCDSTLFSDAELSTAIGMSPRDIAAFRKAIAQANSVLDQNAREFLEAAGLSGVGSEFEEFGAYTLEDLLEDAVVSDAVLLDFGLTQPDILRYRECAAASTASHAPRRLASREDEAEDEEGDAAHSRLTISELQELRTDVVETAYVVSGTPYVGKHGKHHPMFDIVLLGKRGSKRIRSFRFRTLRTFQLEHIESEIGSHAKLISVWFPKTLPKSSFGISLSSRELRERTQQLNGWVKELLRRRWYMSPALRRALVDLFQVDHTQLFAPEARVPSTSEASTAPPLGTANPRTSPGAFSGAVDRNLGSWTHPMASTYDLAVTAWVVTSAPEDGEGASRLFSALLFILRRTTEDWRYTLVMPLTAIQTLWGDLQPGPADAPADAILAFAQRVVQDYLVAKGPHLSPLAPVDVVYAVLGRGREEIGRSAPCFLQDSPEACLAKGSAALDRLRKHARPPRTHFEKEPSAVAPQGATPTLPPELAPSSPTAAPSPPTFALGDASSLTAQDTTTGTLPAALTSERVLALQQQEQAAGAASVVAHQVVIAPPVPDDLGPLSTSGDLFASTALQAMAQAGIGTTQYTVNVHDVGVVTDVPRASLRLPSTPPRPAVAGDSVLDPGTVVQAKFGNAWLLATVVGLVEDVNEGPSVAGSGAASEEEAAAAAASGNTEVRQDSTSPLYEDDDDDYDYDPPGSSESPSVGQSPSPGAALATAPAPVVSAAAEQDAAALRRQWRREHHAHQEFEDNAATEFRSTLRRGVRLLKFNRKGQVAFRTLLLQGNHFISWRSPTEEGAATSTAASGTAARAQRRVSMSSRSKERFDLRELIDVRQGEARDPTSTQGECGTATLRLYASKHKDGAEMQEAGLCLSLIFSERSIDLAADSHAHRDFLLHGFRFLARRGPLGGRLVTVVVKQQKLGLELGTLDGRHPLSSGRSPGGVVASTVERGGPADAAGVRVGDRVARLNGTEVPLALSYKNVSERIRQATRPLRIMLERPAGDGSEEEHEARVRAAQLRDLNDLLARLRLAYLAPAIHDQSVKSVGDLQQALAASDGKAIGELRLKPAARAKLRRGLDEAATLPTSLLDLGGDEHQADISYILSHKDSMNALGHAFPLRGPSGGRLVSVTLLSSSLGMELCADKVVGVVIGSLEPGGEALSAGLRVGDRLVQIHRRVLSATLTHKHVRDRLRAAPRPLHLVFERSHASDTDKQASQAADEALVAQLLREREALTMIRELFRGGEGHLRTWDKTEPLSSWRGVTVALDDPGTSRQLSGGVARLELSHQSFAAVDLESVVATLKSLPRLRVLSLSGNKALTGDLRSLASLKDLRELYLTNCRNITGDVDHLSTMGQLSALNLDNCAGLTGDIMTRLFCAIHSQNGSRRRMAAPGAGGRLGVSHRIPQYCPLLSSCRKLQHYAGQAPAPQSPQRLWVGGLELISCALSLYRTTSHESSPTPTSEGMRASAQAQASRNTRSGETHGWGNGNV